MKQLIKLNYPRYGKVALQEDAHAEVAMGKGKTKKNNIAESRSGINLWLDSSINEIILKRKNQEKYDENKEILFLFRLLTLQYRLKFPLSGNPVQPDFDL